MTGRAHRADLRGRAVAVALLACVAGCAHDEALVTSPAHEVERRPRDGASLRDLLLRPEDVAATRLHDLLLRADEHHPVVPVGRR